MAQFTQTDISPAWLIAQYSNFVSLDHSIGQYAKSVSITPTEALPILSAGKELLNLSIEQTPVINCNDIQQAYLDYFNNYLTLAVFAEHNDITEAEAARLITLGKAIHERTISVIDKNIGATKPH